MNPKELNFAYKVRHALNETAESLYKKCTVGTDAYPLEGDTA